MLAYLILSMIHSQGHRVAVENVIKQNILDKQNSLVDKFMDECDNVALLVPEYLCHRQTKRLVRSGHVPVSIGNEIYSNVTWEYSLRGYISQFLLRRIKGVEAAGLWNWWQQFIETQYSTRLKEGMTPPPTKPSMAGNSVLIFRLLIVCLGIAIACFIWETKKLSTISCGKFLVLKMNTCLAWLRKKEAAAQLKESKKRKHKIIKPLRVHKTITNGQ